MKVVGIDPSLTKTGIALLGGDHGKFMKVGSVGSVTTDSWDLRYRRLEGLADRVVQQAVYDHAWPHLVVMEGPAYDTKGVGKFDSGGLWWLIYGLLKSNGADILIVTPKQRAKYATGNGNSHKDIVVTDAVRRYPQYDFRGNDEADALILAAIGRRLLGDPVEESLPKTHLDALKLIKLPEHLEIAL
ncbi:RuvC-like resolvase superfamily protein [Rhodococcus phage E3]|uniref:RuvC-like Holliday junction resolvase n=1 Tax=Rhodococcus phage E3 TaxID=1007869 RepID=UPI0002C6CEEE|nr:RuvC-like Holliday junction resolvase [Rhodococcus phage E3]AEQ21075.1 RuvC-like resolvase superfamily protein [Rhodococcus phage E3]